MIKEVTRHISQAVERELWARSAGRCQFNGCNRLLYKSPITQEKVNISEKAHIYSFSEKGSRGWGPFKSNKLGLNDIDNLMLVCHDCHKTIDQDKNEIKYSASLLQHWKQEHEQRVATVTGISSDKKSHVIFYGSNISEQKSPICKYEAIEAMFPEKYPANENPIFLSMSCSHEDKTPEFWHTELSHLNRIFELQIQPLISNGNSVNFSLFALAPIPLLIKLGTLLTDKVSVDVFQPIREPKTWKWQQYPDGFEFIVKPPDSYENPPALVISLSDKILHDRITSVLDYDVSIWELTVADAFCHNDMMRHTLQLSQFRSTLRGLIRDIKQKHSHSTPLRIFPAMPVSCSIELGRIRMPKADMPWIIYDQNTKMNRFIKTFTIGDYSC